MSKKCIILLCIIITVTYLFYFSIFLLWWVHDDGELALERVGIGKYFDYNNKEIIKNIYAFTGKEKLLYKYYYSEEKENQLLENIEKHGGWHEIERMNDTDFYFYHDIEKVSKGYLYFFNFDYHNEVFDAYDYYHNIELGGTISQFYRICVIDTEKNIIWFMETKRINKISLL